MKETGTEQFIYDLSSRAVISNGFLSDRYLPFEGKAYNSLKEVLEKQNPNGEIQAVIEAVEKVAETGETVVLDCPLKIKGIRRWFRITLTAYREDGSHISHVFGSLVNTSSLHEQFEQFTGLIRNMPAGLQRYRLTPPFCCEFSSEGVSKLLGYSELEFSRLLNEKKYTAVVSEDELPRLSEFMKKLTAGETVESCEYHIKRKDGKVLTVLETGESRYSPEGILYCYCTFTDISEIEAELNKAKSRIFRDEEELENTRLKNAVAQIQPHFLYNSLAAIREIILEEPQTASDLVMDFSTFLRARVRAASEDDLILFSRELESIRAYLNIEKIYFGDKLKISMELADENFYVAPLSIQPFVENAVRHGIYHRGAAGGTLGISVKRTSDEIILTVCDDGVGFDYDKKMEEAETGKQNSVGMKNAMLRLKKLLHASVSVESTPGVGTTVTVKLPISGQPEGV